MAGIDYLHLSNILKKIETGEKLSNRLYAYMSAAHAYIYYYNGKVLIDFKERYQVKLLILRNYGSLVEFSHVIGIPHRTFLMFFQYRLDDSRVKASYELIVEKLICEGMLKRK